jgi:hypothetical protein
MYRGVFNFLTLMAVSCPAYLVNRCFVHVVFPPCYVHASFITCSSLPLGLSPLLVSSKQLIGNLGHLHVLYPRRNIAFFLIKDLLNDG